MATAFASNFNDDDNCVEPKRNTKKKSLDEIRHKAFTPEQLPQDFLRVVLDRQQIDEKNDKELALRLQYGGSIDQRGMQQPNYNYPFNEFYHENTPARAKQLAASLGRGRLQIDILEARLTKNYGLVKMDPYVKLRLGTKVFETHTDNGGGKNPRWQKTVMCYLPNNVDTLLIEIFDEKSFTNDELIAFVKFPLPESMFNGKFFTEWIPLSGKLGEQKEGHINIQLQFTPTENLNLDPYANLQRQSARPSSTAPNAPQLSPSGSIINQPHQVQLPPESNRIPARRAELFTEQDLNTIKEMFPTYDIEVIKSLMESNGGNKEATIESLLQMLSD